ncbi:uncharacterized protein TrAtP1_012103 [Trichoderma atroviride]|uniref:uncharacterized protein n=1 Tax=Hypocrea atroviridis TaxID=63577 RepID=UPI00332FA961|nr:hypothetical protein TrAtP1_012103 [Trichoderma atroviride]
MFLSIEWHEKTYKYPYIVRDTKCQLHMLELRWIWRSTGPIAKSASQLWGPCKTSWPKTTCPLAIASLDRSLAEQHQILVATMGVIPVLARTTISARPLATLLPIPAYYGDEDR